MHCNFLINTGNATGHDIEALGETVRERVKQNSGIELHWEIKRMGFTIGVIPGCAARRRPGIQNPIGRTGLRLRRAAL